MSIGSGSGSGCGSDTTNNDNLIFCDVSFDSIDILEQYSHRRPYLHYLLQETLPKLGLDCDLYGPYVWGDDDDDGDNNNEDWNCDLDEIRDVVQGILQASSETHSDTDKIWETLIIYIVKANDLDTKRQRESREQKLQETKTKLEDDLAQAKLEEQQQQEKEPSSSSNNNNKVDNEAKLLLVQRYGYEEPAEDSTATTTTKTKKNGIGAAAAGGMIATSGR